MFAYQGQLLKKNNPTSQLWNKQLLLPPAKIYCCLLLLSVNLRGEKNTSLTFCLSENFTSKQRGHFT